ncbi:MAG: cell division protein FtsZ [Thermoplasmatales archaeon]|nr:cell division protein FtsZ [Thermoplasmatales archaeon]
MMKKIVTRGEVSKEDEELVELLRSLQINIKVAGCGGSGCNTITRIVEEGIVGAELVAMNTDAQHLLKNVRAQKKILLGKHSTRGLGAGAIPIVGESAAIEAEDEIKRVLSGAHIAFITSGLGGGTGTGGLPVVAKIARDLNALTIAVVTLPFKAEGFVRMKNALMGLEKLKDVADTVIVIPNDKLLELVPRLPLNAAFRFADEILMRSIKSIVEMMTKPGLINVDYADLKTIMRNGGVAMISLGESDGDDRARKAVQQALSSPLLDVDITNATGALINVCGGPDMTVAEAQAVVEEVHKKVSPEATIIWGASIDPALEHSIRVMIVVTGISSEQIFGRAERDVVLGTKAYDIDTVR